MPTHIAIVESDSAHAARLAYWLDKHFSKIVTVHSLEELRSAISAAGIELAVIDLDLVRLDEVARLRNEFGLDVVCVHRVADERMWAAALSAGAIDCCYRDDASSIVAAATSSRNMTAAA